MTKVGRNMQCTYTSDIEEILKLKTFKGFKVKLRVRQLITNK
jgi:hypothetical protein